MSSLRREDIDTAVMHRPIHLQPYSPNRFRSIYVPTAELIGKQSFALLLHVCMVVENAESVVRALRCSL